MLKVENLHTSYGVIEALRGVNISSGRGALTCILGPNGAGKTTLLFSICGILSCSKGSILFDGELIHNQSAPKIVEKGLALVPENRLVFPYLTVQENLLAGAYTRLKKDRIAVGEDIESMFAKFPVLKERNKQLAGTLSGGEQQMLAFGRALMSKPKLLLMDEPSVGLAPKIVNEIFSTIKALSEEGITIVLVEQNASKALEIGDYFYLLDRGEVTFEGQKTDFSKDEILKKAYLGES